VDLCLKKNCITSTGGMESPASSAARKSRAPTWLAAPSTGALSARRIEILFDPASKEVSCRL
jgi:hypothetical protein